MSFSSRRAAFLRLGIFLSLLLFSPRPAHAADETATYVDALVVKARETKLADDPQWMRLGHWYRGASGDMRAEPDAPDWFQASNGKTDPAAEMEATIRAFFYAPEPTDPKAQHPVCRYPARLAFLTKKLGLDPNRLKKHDCKKLAEFMQKLQPGSATLIFTSYYLNSPASAFGHSFLRINKRRAANAANANGAGARVGVREEGGGDLLDYGIDYSAIVDTGNAVMYAFKGLTGLFPGTFKAVPYFFKVREYNDFESRDLWEYDLALDEKETELLTFHIWELGSTYFDYYYLSENCSYHVLAAIETVNPKYRLLEYLKYPVIPADTVKALYKNPGLVAHVRYRPSLRTIFAQRTEKMNTAEKDAVEAITANPDAPISDAIQGKARIAVIDAAADLVDIRYAKDLLHSTPNSEGEKIKQRLLARRSEIAIASDDPEIVPPWRRMPNVGHGSQRIMLGPGYSSQGSTTQSGGSGFGQLEYRLALHDLGDPTPGYPELSQIEFLPTRVRFYPKGRAFELENFSIVRVVSLSPQTQFQRSMSWKVRAGITRLRDSGCFDCAAPDAEIGVGLAFPFAKEALTLYFTADTYVAGHRDMHGIKDSVLRAGVGPFAGARVRFGEDLVWLTGGRWLYLPLQKPFSTWSADTTLRWQYTYNFALGVELRAQPLAVDGQIVSAIYF